MQLIFLQDLHQKADELSAICHGISYKDTGELVLPSPTTRETGGVLPPYSSVNNIPGYCKPLYKTESGLTVKKYASLQGFAICLDAYSSVEQYMEACFNKKVRGNIMRCKRRLEKCYDISYDRFYGEIEEGHCSSLLDCLYDMIVARFRERQESNATLAHWEQIKNTLYPLILSRKASLYVISQAGTPICISISYHYGSMLFYYVTSYDIAYSKFSLGNIMIIKQLESCFEEGGYRYIEMGWGYMDYKRRWCNTTHTFEHHFICPTDSWKGRAYSLVRGNQTAFVAYLQDKPLYKFYHRLKAALKKRAMPKPASAPVYQLVEMSGAANADGLTSISTPARLDIPMNQLLNDFLYHTEENTKDVCFLEDRTHGALYLKGKHHFSKVVLKG